MKTKLLLLVLLISMTYISCQKKAAEAQQPDNITPVTIAKGEVNFSSLEIGNYVIKNDSVWQDILTMFSRAINIDYFFTETNIDFSQYMVIAVIDTMYPSASYSVDITDIELVQDTIRVHYTNLQAGDAAVPSQPFHVVKIRTRNEPVEFIRY